ncbi:MAG: NADH-quinone oxidoreductase subunit N, partial [Terriglobia bacterium]
MSATDLFTILPLLILGGASVVVMVVIAIRRNHAVTLALTLIGLAAAFASLFWVAQDAPRQVSSLLVVDRYALFYMGLVIAATFAVALLSYSYFERREDDPEELYVLLLIAALGSAVLVSSSHFVSFFLGLEILSVALYTLNAYLHTRRFPLEAGIKYLILAASSAAFLLFGMALVYSELGTMEFSRIRQLVTASPDVNQAVLLAGAALIITGFGFKLALVPFHLWTPDIYEGAPAPVTAFVATVSKGAMFALLLRYFTWSGTHHYGAIFLVFTIIAIASMIVGNFLAMMQGNVKRILAYSSIAHMGYLLVAFQAGGELASQAVAFYLVAYFITTIGAFGVVSIMSDGERDADSIDDYRGLFWRRPILASVFTAMLLSLAGIP